MRAVVQRVAAANVEVAGDVKGAVGPGLLVLLGIAPTDTAADCEAMAAKLAGLRIFRDADDKMNLSVGDIGGAVLVISQFTLYGDARRGRRPSFVDAAPPELAEPLVATTIAALERLGIPTEAGIFGANMAVTLTNDGPVTLILEVVDGRIV